MTGVQLAQFQEAAVEHIVRRLRDKHGSQRMLLADEVGLGKTIVARGVIEAMALRNAPLTVIYLCSNNDIAEQNRKKLDPRSGAPIGRVTRLALEQPESGRDVLLYSFTPGTSLREGTGLAWERRLLLYLVHRLYDEPVWTKRWREFFRCGAGEDQWHADTSWASLSDEFRRKTTTVFRTELAGAWRDLPFDGEPVRSAMRDLVARFDSGDPNQRAKRNRFVALLRGRLQRVALRNLRPQLVILDEVQRFRDVLEQAKQPGHIASDLFSRGVPVLVLSATPYRSLTLGHEIGDSEPSHYEDFFETLAFLFDDDLETPSRIRANLARFGKELNKSDLIERTDHELLKLKRELEADLRQVICRTERNWYVLDRRKGIEEVLGECTPLPNREELEEYLRLHRALAPLIGGTAQVTEFWKSAPSLLTFLDAEYALLRKLRDERVKVPRTLLAPASSVHALAERNHRIERVVNHALGKDGAMPQLWTAPTYKYYRDDFFGEVPPRKLLVFSGWRFVPKTIAIIASQVASNRLGVEPEDPSQPLKFSDRRSFHVFDVCFPSPALAEIVNVRSPAIGVPDSDIEAHDFVNAAILGLRAALRDAGVTVVTSGGDTTWRVVARLEERFGHATQIRRALDEWQPGEGEDEPSAAVRQHRDWVKDWLNDNRAQLQLSEPRLRRLALVAVFSPANSLWRALASVYGRDAAGEAFPQIANLCLGPMRRYFNRPHVQQVIRRHEGRMNWSPTRSGTEHGYAERVLLYAADAHLQAVLDEYAYLLCHAAQFDTVQKAIDQLEAVWTLSRGSPRTNGARGQGPMVRIEPDDEVHATHFALAFGADVSRDTGSVEEDGRIRKSVVREAFNSPFWPFVLATTSVGQEGLDFHLYCRDILHWNLPSNPVDLEQREGRINRRDCLAVRASIARDWPVKDDNISAALRRQDTNVWSAVFERLAQHEDPQRYKHGLYPHWVYECRNPLHTVRIQRHIVFFATSRDAVKYERLKTGLALYRLVFGQVNQEDLLDRLHERIELCPTEEGERILRRLAGYMLNLSPIGHEQAVKHSESEANDLVTSKSPATTLGKLLTDVALLRAEHPSELVEVGKELDDLVRLVVDSLSVGDVKSKNARRAVAALAYLRNPYDRIFDLHVEDGFSDDVDVIRNAHKACTATELSDRRPL